MASYLRRRPPARITAAINANITMYTNRGGRLKYVVISMAIINIAQTRATVAINAKRSNTQDHRRERTSGRPVSARGDSYGFSDIAPKRPPQSEDVSPQPIPETTALSAAPYIVKFIANATPVIQRFAGVLGPASSKPKGRNNASRTRQAKATSASPTPIRQARRQRLRRPVASSFGLFGDS